MRCLPYPEEMKRSLVVAIAAAMSLFCVIQISCGPCPKEAQTAHSIITMKLSQRYRLEIRTESNSICACHYPKQLFSEESHA
jgi:hypothetical protein